MTGAFYIISDDVRSGNITVVTLSPALAQQLEVHFEFTVLSEACACFLSLNLSDARVVPYSVPQFAARHRQLIGQPITVGYL